ncbi:phosphoesterase [Cohnella xylanilytica]|uniref:Phosphoesterase n=1 Tax=Cohnella xylanilytica TaxID=557555 RepID=A0A841U604_9BACL|nr:metallophosphoesterase [Cohnella xylanilytica]MBB6695062.1 metallophosphoesterase [Cohnella xylanilytica]GIO13877.1 phosphoesterase [Cohnella xylanilytica]
MLIGVVSDTHMPRMAKSLPPPLVQAFGKVDRIVHAGDWTELGVLAELEKLAPVDGVAGNNDGPDIVKRFGLRKILKLGGKRIGLVHGHGEGARSSTEARALRAFQQSEVDCIVYGHSHVPVLKEVNGVIVFNPGSPTAKRKQPQYSFGLIKIEGTRISARHVFYKEKS